MLRSPPAYWPGISLLAKCGEPKRPDGVINHNESLVESASRRVALVACCDKLHHNTITGLIERCRTSSPSSTMKPELQTTRTCVASLRGGAFATAFGTAGIEAYVEGGERFHRVWYERADGFDQVQSPPRAHSPGAASSVGFVQPRRRPWYCGTCQEMNEPSFDYCWQCEGERDTVEAEIPAPTATPHESATRGLLSPHPVTSEYNTAPYAPPTSDLAPPTIVGADRGPTGGSTRI